MDAKILLNDFINHLSIEKAMNPGTVRNYQAYVQRLIGFVETIKLNSDLSQKTVTVSIDEITPEIVESFKKDLTTNLGISKKTVNCYLVGIRVFLKYLEDKKKVKCMNPYDVVMYKRVEKKALNLMGDSNLADFLNYELDRDSDLLANLLFSTGLRIFELHKLNLEDIKTENVKINEQQTIKAVPFNIVGKGDKVRRVYMLESGIKKLEEYKKNVRREVGPIFLNSKNERISLRSLQRMIEYRREMLLPKDIEFSAHTLRHHFATYLIGHGFRLHTLQKILGHSSILTTEKYLHSSDSDVLKEFYSVPDINKVF